MFIDKYLTQLHNNVVIKMSETKQLIIEIDENIRTELRMVALKQKKTVKEIVTNLITEYIEENK